MLRPMNQIKTNHPPSHTCKCGKPSTTMLLDNQGNWGTCESFQCIIDLAEARKEQKEALQALELKGLDNVKPVVVEVKEPTVLTLWPCGVL